MSNEDITPSPGIDFDFLRNRIQRLEKVLEIQQRFALHSGFLDDSMTVKDFLDHLSETLFLIDKTGTIILMNAAGENLLGYSTEDIAGHHLNILLPERYKKHHDKLMHDYFRHPRHRPMGMGLELFAVKKDGREIPVEISLSYLKSTNEVYALAFIHDISERKRKESELVKKNAELEAYSRTVAHDINSSLASIVMLSDDLSDSLHELEMDEIRTYLSYISQTARKLSVIVKEMLLFTQIEKDKISIEDVDMEKVVKEALSRVQSHINRKKAVVSLKNKLHHASGHQVWVEEIWYNLIENALKYGGTPPVIEIGSEKYDEQRCKYYVKDNGDGISPEALARLTSGEPEKGDVKGHGIGLSIVRMILEKLNGEVNATSEAGQGTVFYFSLPYITATDPSPLSNHQ